MRDDDANAMAFYSPSPDGVREGLEVALVIVKLVRELYEWFAGGGFAPKMPPSASLAALQALIASSPEARARLVEKARQDPELREQLATVAASSEQLTVLVKEIDHVDG
jgi:hypothetical protein